MTPELSLLQMAALQVLVLVVSAATGVVAFGFAMAMTPFLLIFLEPRLVVEVNLVLTAVLFGAVALNTWRNVNAGTLVALLIGGAVGIPFGVLYTGSLTGGILSLTMNGVVIVTALLAMLNRFPRFRRERAAGVVVGGVFTFINAGLALGGPMVAVFALKQRWNKDQARATMSVFFLVTGMAILASHAATGLLGRVELQTAALFVPALIAGSLAASRLAGRVDETLFRRLVLAVLLATSLSVLGREVWSML